MTSGIFKVEGAGLIRDRYYIRSIGVPLAVATVGNHNKDERTITALYLQDTITTSALTASIGVRYDFQRGANRASALPRNDLLPELLPGLGFGGLKSAFTWKTLTPKLNRITWSAINFPFDLRSQEDHCVSITPGGGHGTVQER